MSEQAHPGEQWVICNRIRELRRAKGLSQKELAREVSINPRTVGYLERHDQRLDLRLAWQIADLFGVGLEDVFYRLDYPLPSAEGSTSLPPYKAEPHDEIGQALESRPAAREVLSALLDGYGVDQDRLARRAGLEGTDLHAELSALGQLGLVEESVQPGPVFGRPHHASFALSSEGRRRIVEFHRSLPAGSDSPQQGGRAHE